MDMTPYRESTETTRTLKELFWRNGYENTSIEDVVQATGLNRYSLYNAFGGKRELFLAALDDYYFERKNRFLTSLDDPDTHPLEAVREVMEFAIREMADRGAGCFMCNVASERGLKDPVIAERIKTYLAEIEFAFGKALSRAESIGGLNEDITSEDGATILITVLLGIGAHAQAGAPSERLTEALHAALRAVGKT